MELADLDFNPIRQAVVDNHHTQMLSHHFHICPSMRRIYYHRI